MASPFEITTPGNTVALDNKREGTAVFTARNLTRRRLRAVARILTQPADSPAAGWLSIVPANGGTTAAPSDVRDFAIDATQQYQVRVVAPTDAPPGSYAFRLIVADEINPDENFTQSPDTTFTVIPPPKPEPKRIPSWVFAVIAVVVLIVIGIVFFAINSSNRAQESANATATATVGLALTRAAADLQTQAAATAAAAGTQAAVSVYSGNWVPVDNNPSGILTLSLTASGTTRYNLAYTSRCPPAGNLCLSNPQSFSVNNIAYDPDRLVAAIQNTVITIEPQAGRLLVTAHVNGTPSAQVFQRSRGRFDEIIDFAAEAQLPGNFLQSLDSQAQFQFLQLTPTGP